MALWFDLGVDGTKPVLLTTPEQILLREIMIALKQTRSELNGIRQVLVARAKKDGLEVSQDADRS